MGGGGVGGLQGTFSPRRDAQTRAVFEEVAELKTQDQNLQTVGPSSEIAVNTV